MNIRYISTATLAMALGAYSLAIQSNEMNDNTGRHNRMAPQPTSDYWQAPNWPNLNAPPARSSRPTGSARSPARNKNDQNSDYRPRHRSAPSPNDRQTFQANQYPVRNNNRQVMNQPDWGGTPPRPPKNAYRGTPYPPQQHMNQYRPENTGPAQYNPGYRQTRPNNSWNPNVRNNRFRGNSAPDRRMNLNRGNMSRGWNDMTNGPTRMGKMPGGWRAPEISMPNPVDVGDQVQENVGGLPEQMRNMDVNNRSGNN